MRTLKWMIPGLALVLAGAQFVQPERTNPPADPAASLVAVVKPPAQAAAVLERSCRDCHSNRTEWPCKIFSAAALAAVASVFLVIGAAAQIYGPRCRVHRFSWVLWRLQDPDFFSLAFICSGTSAHEMEPEPAAWSLAIGFAAVVLLEHATALVTRG